MSAAPLVYQDFVGRALCMSWADARAFVAAQGVRTYARGASTRTWAMAASDWDRLAERIGAATPLVAEARMADSVDRANRALAHLAPPSRRRRAPGNTSRSSTN